MSDRWLYRISGKEFGPVSLDLVKTLVAAGTIAPDDEVKNASRSNWILACSATELSGSIQTPVADLVAERRAVRDEWYCRSSAGAVGPLAMTDLIQLAADGELKPEEEVKTWADDYWRQISSISRLIELLPFANNGALNDRFQLHPMSQVNGRLTQKTESRFANPNRSSVDEVKIIPFPGVVSSVAEDVESNNRDKNSTVTDSQSNSDQVERNSEVETSAKVEMDAHFAEDKHQGITPRDLASKWSGWMSGQEFGPVDFPQLLMWAVTGQLSPTDFVRRGDETQYVPAVNVPCLFTVRAAASSLARRQIMNPDTFPTVHFEEMNPAQ